MVRWTTAFHHSTQVRDSNTLPKPVFLSEGPLNSAHLVSNEILTVNRACSWPGCMSYPPFRAVRCPLASWEVEARQFLAGPGKNSEHGNQPAMFACGQGLHAGGSGVSS
jgi:hypothetical protein